MKINIGDGVIEILKGDITEQETNVIVNAANNHFWMGSGVAGAIKRIGGEQVETEAVAQGPVDVGGAVITTAGNLSANYVIHAAGMGQDLQTDKGKVKAATHSSLLLAEEKEQKSISFPAIGTGVGGFSIDACAQVMLAEAVEFLQESEHLKIINFVLFDDSGLEAFKTALRNIFSA